MKRQKNKPCTKAAPLKGRKSGKDKSLEAKHENERRPGDEQFGGGPGSYNGLLHESLIAMRMEMHDPVLAHTWQHLLRYLIPTAVTKIDPLARQTSHARYKGHSSITATICFVEAWAAHNRRSYENAVEGLDTEQFECIWRARQNADLLGVEYRAYIEAMNLLYGPDGSCAGLKVSTLSGPLSLALAYRQLRSAYAGMPLPVEIEAEILGDDISHMSHATEVWMRQAYDTAGRTERGLPGMC
ncbi:hypothetical protein M8R20_45175 [Pseudomonas sp. R2.Fl]|nr:hypothetical protein [Pseudomonas sp. R2.Fl]